MSSTKPLSAAAELERIQEEALIILHDLRSPFAVILSNVDYLASEPYPAAQHREALQDIRGAAAHAVRIVENLLELTRLESERPVVRRTTASLASVLRIVVDRRRRPAIDQGIELRFEARGRCEVELDVDLTARVLDNILDNAFRHTPRDGRIEVSVVDLDDRIRISIGNTGPAIPVDQREAVFEKYGQWGGSNQRLNLGLGLYFCRMAVEGRGGTIRVESSAELPTQFVIELPVNS